MDGLYEQDIARWSEQQTDALRRRAVNEVDWENVAEEIESVGSEQRSTIEALLTNIMQHALQVMAWPEAGAVSHWQHEIAAWRVTIRRRLKRSPSLRPAIEAELPELYADALEAMYREVDGVPRPAMPPACPFTLNGLLERPEQ